MQDRRQERLGWIGGWLGGFVWVFILSTIFLVQGRLIEATLGYLIGCAAVATIFFVTPWHFPRTSYRTLMLPVYLFFFTALAWGVWALEDLHSLGINSPWAAFLLLPALLPLWIAGGRRWEDGDPRDSP